MDVHIPPCGNTYLTINNSLEFQYIIYLLLKLTLNFREY